MFHVYLKKNVFSAPVGWLFCKCHLGQVNWQRCLILSHPCRYSVLLSIHYWEWDIEVFRCDFWIIHCSLQFCLLCFMVMGAVFRCLSMVWLPHWAWSFLRAELDIPSGLWCSVHQWYSVNTWWVSDGRVSPSSSLIISSIKNIFWALPVWLQDTYGGMTRRGPCPPHGLWERWAWKKTILIQWWGHTEAGVCKGNTCPKLLGSEEDSRRKHD